MEGEEFVERSQEIKGCVECGHPVVVKGYPTPLCSGCRTGFINYPIPRWIMLFAAGIGIIALFSMYKLPYNFKAARHLEKAKTAIENKQYLTAEKELLLAAKRYPDNVEINAYMVVASFYNNDLFSVNQYLQKLRNANADDQELVTMVNAVTSEADYYYPNEALLAVINRYDSSIVNVPADSLQSYINYYPNDVYAKNAYAGIFYGKEDYKATDSLLQEVIKLHPDNITALVFLASVKRQLNQQDASMKYCDQMLNINAENTFAMGSKARTLMKLNKDQEAYTLCTKALAINPHDYYTMASLLMACEFTKKGQEKKELELQISKVRDSTNEAAFQYAYDVISGKEEFKIK